MNVNISPEQEYQMMQAFFTNGGVVENMPEEMLRTRRLWKRADEIIRKAPWYDNEKIANQLISDFPEYTMSLSAAKRHVTAAKKYFDFVETDTPATHRRILTSLLYKQMAKLIEYQPYNPVQTAKVIEQLSNRIAAINHLYEKEEQGEADTGDLNLIISTQEINFPDIKQLTSKELYTIIDEITDCVELTDEEKQLIIQKDVENKLT